MVCSAYRLSHSDFSVNITAAYNKSTENKYKLVVDEKTAPIVLRIFELRCSGNGYSTIADILNNERIIPPRDYFYASRGSLSTSAGLWSGETIKKILRNEVYMGHTVQCKTGTKSYKSRKLINKPREDWIKVPDTHEAIVSNELWLKAAALSKGDSCKKSSLNSEHLFKGLLRCADCNAPLRSMIERGTRKNGSQYEYRSFMCGNYSRYGKKSCSIHIIYENALNTIVLKTIQDDVNLADMSRSAVGEIVSKLSKSKSSLGLQSCERELKRHRARLKKLGLLIERLYEDHVDGRISESVFNELMEKYGSERRFRQSETEILESRLSARAGEVAMSAAYEGIINCHIAEMPEAKTLLALVDKIEVSEANLDEGRRTCSICVYYKYVKPYYPSQTEHYGEDVAEG